jgi:hypothetical protein
VPDLLDHRLETLLVEPRTVPAWTRTQQKMLRRRRARRTALVASMAAVVALFVGLAFVGDDQATQVDTGPASSPDGAGPFPSGWSRLPDADLPVGETAYPVLVGAGDELTAWAGSETATGPISSLVDGMGFDVGASAWKPLDAFAAGGSGRPGALPVGDEVLFVGTGTDAVRWSPDTNESTTLELRDGCTVDPVEAGGRWWFACGTSDTTAATGLSSTDPTTGEWQDHGTPAVSITFPAASITAADGAVFLAGGELQDDFTLEGAALAAYDTSEGAWRELPAPPIGDATSTAVAATEHEVVIAVDEMATVLDLGTGEWSDPVVVDALALPPSVPYPFGCLTTVAHAVGERLVLVGCEGVAVLQDDGSWRSEQLAMEGAVAAATVADDVLYVANPAGEIWAFVP